MTDMSQLPDDVDSLKQLVLERDATLVTIKRALHEAQLCLDQLALLVNKSRQLQLAAEERARVATFTAIGSTGPKSAPVFAESVCTCARFKSGWG